MKKPARYRDVLAMLKAMARDPRLTDGAIRAVLGGNIGEGADSYTQADIVRTRELAKEHGWELGTTLEPSAPETDLGTPERYQDEIRRLHAQLRTTRDQLKTAERNLGIAHEKSNVTSAKRHAQMKAAGVASVDEAFVRLERFRVYIAAHGLCHSDSCGDDPALEPSARQAFIQAHQDDCTCGADEIFALADRSVSAAFSIDATVEQNT